jgi:transposase
VLQRNPYGVSVWTEILLQKYLYCEPTNRLLQSLETRGLPISQGSITDGLKRLSPLFEPLRDAFYEKQMLELLFHADETRWMVFEEVEGKIGYRWYLWVFRSESVVYYRITESRATKVPLEHFGKLAPPGDEPMVILVCDRYVAYKCLVKQIDMIVLAFCWAHVRRDFLNATTSYPDEEEWMLSWVDDIGNLYHINKQRLAAWDRKLPLGKQSSAFLEHHTELKTALSDMETRRDEHLAQEKLAAPRKAVLTSLKEHWEGLTVFVEHPQVPMDNNNGEHSIRGPVVGRKNYYGSGSKWSATLAAMMFTLLQTVKLLGINPHHWLTFFLTACAENGGKTPDDLTPFIPWSMDEELKQKLSRPMLDSPPDDTS